MLTFRFSSQRGTYKTEKRLSPYLCVSVTLIVMAILATSPPILSQEESDELAERAAAAREVATMLSNASDGVAFLSLNDVHMGQALDRLEAVLGCKIGWNASNKAAAEPVSIELEGEPVETAFERIFYPRNCIHIAEFKMRIPFFRIIDDPLTPLHEKALDPEENEELLLQLSDLFTKAMTAWAEEDVEAFLSLCAEEVIRVGTGVPSGREELEEMLTEIFEREVFSEFAAEQLVHTKRMVAIQVGNLPEEFDVFTIEKESFKPGDIVLAAPAKVLIIIDETIVGPAKLFIVRKIEGQWLVVGF